MAFTLIHGLISFLIVSRFTKNEKLRLIAFIAGMLPDLDGIALFWDINLYYEFHHELFHAPVYGIIFGAIFALILNKYFKLDKIKVFLVFSFSFIFHSITDLFTTFWPVKMFWPFSSEQFVFPFLQEFNLWIALIVFALTGMQFCLEQPITKDQ
ncbi:MAG: hypothetical protein COT90_04495 [Candidatus Diapherotrites archaeon CG10_big_fil_rev_8_21_14_0_10_31_34]|nr:MAG: hypothetical protein COT90_04495 [Candidatus Diapherotrites archaeon CG10_big_fil_rev_8_21_14_0_10_31_34]